MKKLAKGLISFGVLFILAGLFFRYKDDVYIKVDQYLSPYKYVTLGDVNDYYRNENFLYVQNTDNFVPRNEQDIINTTQYDTPRASQGDTTYHSDIAYGPLFEGKAVCGGYTDAMQLFLEKLQVRSFRVSSEKHVWNAVYYNNKWLNLDLTWDDPVASDGKDYLEYDFFLINTTRLQQIETTEHTFDVSHYLELKEA